MPIFRCMKIVSHRRAPQGTVVVHYLCALRRAAVAIHSCENRCKEAIGFRPFRRVSAPTGATAISV